MERRQGFLAVTVCYTIWGILPIFWKLFSGLDSFYILSHRCLWSFVFCLPLITLTKRWGDVRAVFRDRRKLLLTLAAGALVGFNWGTYIFAVGNAYIVEASLGYYINPLLISALGFLLFQERFNKFELWALGLAVAAVLYFAIRLSVVPWISLAIALSFGFYGAVKKLSGVESSVSMTVETMLLAPIALVMLTLFEIGGNGAIGNVPGWEMAILPLAGICTLVPMLLYGYGVKRLDYSICGMLLYINPTLQLLLGILLYGEDFTITHGITFTLIWISVILFLVGQRKKTNK